MFAIIQTGGKQYKVSVGDEIYIEKLNAEAESTVEFTEVLAVQGERTLKTGTPFVKGAVVTATVLKNGKGKKIHVMTYRPKKDSKRKIGHRQPYTKVQITAIEG